MKEDIASADIIAWQKEMEESKTKRLDWYGWLPESGVSKMEYFNEQEISCHCAGSCKDYYLNETGGPLERTETPLCGTW